MTADALEALAASATAALRTSVVPPRHCQACGAALPYLGGQGRPRRWCDAHHPRPLVFAHGRQGAPEGRVDSGLGQFAAERKKGPGLAR